MAPRPLEASCPKAPRTCLLGLPGSKGHGDLLGPSSGCWGWGPALGSFPSSWHRLLEGKGGHQPQPHARVIVSTWAPQSHSKYSNRVLRGHQYQAHFTDQGPAQRAVPSGVLAGSCPGSVNQAPTGTPSLG